MIVRFLTMEKELNRRLNSVGSSRIRARWVWKYWDEADEWMIGEKTDVIIFQKVYTKTLIYQFDCIKIFDICDPDWLEPRPVFETIRQCDAVSCATQPLVDYIKKFVKDKPVVLIPDRVDLEEHKPVKKKHEGRAKSVIWFGYSHNFPYLPKTFDYLLEHGLHLTIVADKNLMFPKQYESLRHSFRKYEYPEIHQEIIKNDIVLLPAGTDIRAQYKSNNKKLTSWALGMPVATTPEELERFLDPDERNKEAKMRMKYVKKHYDVRKSVGEYKQLVSEIIRKKRAKIG